MPDLLQGYYWNKAARRYMRRGQAGFVSRARIIELLERSVTQRQVRVQAGAQALADGRISPATFVARTAGMLKRQYLQERALAVGGWDRLTQADFGRIGGRLRAEYRRLAVLAEQLFKGEISVAQAQNRLRMYMGNARHEFFEGERAALPPPDRGNIWIERRLLGQAEHCPDCVEFADRGWQPAGLLPLPTEASVCDGNCRCGLSRRQVPETEAQTWIGQKR